MICGNITYKITTDSEGSTPLQTGKILSIDTSTSVYLIVTYSGSDLSATDVTQNGAAFKLQYAQA